MVSINAGWDLVFVMISLYLVLPFAIGLTSIGMVSWCAESIRASDGVWPMPPLVLTTLTLLGIGTGLAWHDLHRAAFTLLTIAVLSGCVVALRFSSTSQTGKPLVPLLIALAYLGGLFALFSSGGATELGGIVVTLLSTMCVLVVWSLRLAIVLGVSTIVLVGGVCLWIYVQ